MATFYLLPARGRVGEFLAECLQPLFPGMSWKPATLGELTDALDAVLAGQGDVFLVHREDLPANEDPLRSLIDGCGAEPGDEVIEVRLGTRKGEIHGRRWQVSECPNDSAILPWDRRAA